MSTWDNQDEYGDIEEESSGNGFGSMADTTNSSGGLPSSVTNRLYAYAKRIGQSNEVVVKAFLELCKTQHNTLDPMAEDEDLLVDWAESLVVETRRQSGGGNGKLLIAALNCVCYMV